MPRDEKSKKRMLEILVSRTNRELARIVENTRRGKWEELWKVQASTEEPFKKIWKQSAQDSHLTC